MIIKVKYNYGDPIYLKLDPEQLEYHFTGIVASMGQIKYRISRLGEEMEVFDYETSHEQDELKKLLNDKEE